MSNKNHLSNLAFCTVLVISSNAAAQNNLTVKVNNVQPQPVSSAVESDRVRDGLAGPVRRLRTEVAKLSNANGRPTEDKRVLLEIASYDIKGAKTQNQYFPVAGSALTGKEIYKYDEKGNINEMTLLNNDGSLLSKEVYKYEYDFMGNWTKMTTSVAVVDGGQLIFEPSEVTYRSIMYYLDENMMKTILPSPPPATGAATSSAATPAVNDTKPATSSPPSRPQPTAEPPKSAKRHQSVGRKPAPSVPTPRTVSNRATDSAELMKSGFSASDNTAMVSLDSEPPPPSSTPKPFLKPMSGGVLNSNAISLPAPYYPDAAKRMRTMGLVTVEVVIDETGKVISAQATSGPGVLREAAVQAAMRARFSPTRLSGQPVKVTGVINYKFTILQ
jgi:periplasmic protein TonB